MKCQKSIAKILSVTVSFPFAVAFMLNPVKAEAARKTFTDDNGVKYQVIRNAVYDEDDDYDDEDDDYGDY